RDVDVVTVGFYNHPTIDMAGCSPDGLVGDDGLVEIKCPSTHNHIATLLGEPISGEYLAQVHWQMICTGRQWCDWVSFDDRLPPRHQLFVQRLERSDIVSELMQRDAITFLAEVDKRMAQLEARRMAA